MRMHLVEVENDVDDNRDGTTTQTVVLRFAMDMYGSSKLSDITPIQSLIGRLVDVQIADAKAIPAQIKAASPPESEQRT